MSTANALKVRAVFYDRLRERIALHDDSDGMSHPSDLLTLRASQTRRHLAQDIVDSVRSAGTATDEELEHLAGIQLGDILDDLIDSDTLTMTITGDVDRYRIAI